MSVVELLLFFFGMLLTCIVMWGFLLNARQELKKAKWIPKKRRLPQIKLSNLMARNSKVDVLVCKTDGTMVVAGFDYERKTFDVPDVEAWRPLPLSYHRSIRQMMGIFSKIKELGKRKN